jgi:antitoxin component YwqK of YwqJK toxin-antitoxin module
MLPVADKANALSYRTSELRADEKIYDVKMFALDGTLTFSGSYLDKECMVREGELVFYYPNGQKKNSSYWKNGIPQGKTSQWYRNGQLKTVREYREKHIAVVEFYDSLGNQKVIDGNGEYEEEDADETLVKRVTIRGQVQN